MYYVLTADYKIHRIEENSNFYYIKKNHLFFKSLCLNLVKDLDLGAVLRRVETLDQLCDGYALEKNNELISVYLKRDGWFFDQVKSLAYDGEYNLYGFIKTSDSLLYITRLSSNGNLI